MQVRVHKTRDGKFRVWAKANRPGETPSAIEAPVDITGVKEAAEKVVGAMRPQAVQTRF